jgi:hypothetical protein
LPEDTEPETPKFDANDAPSLFIRQESAFVEDQDKVDDCPDNTLSGFAVKKEIAGGGVTAITIGPALAEPAYPLHVIEKLVSDVKLPVEKLNAPGVFHVLVPKGPPVIEQP